MFQNVRFFRFLNVQEAFMKGIPLESVEEHSYLRVTLHHRMSWKPHIKNICNKANRLLGFLKEMAYKKLILPSLGYCAPIWDPFHHNLIYQLHGDDSTQSSTFCTEPTMD